MYLRKKIRRFHRRNSEEAGRRAGGERGMKPENEAQLIQTDQHPLYDLRLLYGDSPGGEHLYRTVPVQPDVKADVGYDAGGEPDPDRPAEPVCGCVAPAES